MNENATKLIKRIPLGPNGSKGEATIYQEDYDYLMSIGLSSSWNLWPNGYVIACAYKAKGNNVSVPRVLLDARQGEVVHYVDGNRLNLRRDNLELYEGYAKHRDRDFLTEPKKKIIRVDERQEEEKERA